ncbi:MAG TPA: 2-amino-4-hydroxy-6-hydroxymethyldihydropteridine diphosphokinase [Nitrospirota bacterium]|nr:2-amino-4-hydroxy-6-hydroxymethyldihydropteridine diphosphokinase [Nitrospirota bacterium]
MMERAFVSVGSNIDPENNVIKAVRLLGAQTHVRAISTVYLTEPIGRAGQPPYYNCMLEIETVMPPLDLKRTVLRHIEDSLGRVRNKDKFAPRTIDLDLVLYDGITMDAEELTLPDPEILHRPFLAFSLHELAPDLILPGSGARIADVAAGMQRETMNPLESYTDMLREEIGHGSKHGKDPESRS